MRPARVLSGGQTGVDRAALDAAIELGIPYGGWCPAGGWAEDLPDPPGLLAAYPVLRETPEHDPAVRTRLNVRESDAVLVLHRGPLEVSTGTRLTVSAATDLGRPTLVCRIDEDDPVGRIAGWWPSLRARQVSLDVAGPRESEDPGIHAATRALLHRVWA